MQKGRYTLGLVATLVALLIISACSPGNSSTNVQTVANVLKNSTNAMKQLKTAHVDMTMTANVGASGITPTAGSTTPTNMNIHINGTGDEVLPDQASLKLTLSFASLNMGLAEIMQGNKIYFQNSKGQWYVMDKSALLANAGSGTTNPFSGASVPDFNKLLNLAQHAQITDHGDQSLNGANLRHITITLDKNGLNELLQSTSQLGSLTGASQQMLNQLANSTKNFHATLDFWIDEATSYIHRTEMKFNLSLDMGSFATPGTASNTPSAITLAFDMTVDLSKFNDSSIKITAPANAIPTNNPSTIFSSGQ